MKKKISFTLFGDNPKYTIGAVKNINQFNTMLPGWEIVIYYHKNMINENTLINLKNHNVTMIDVSEVRLTKKPVTDYPYFWRFFAFFDDESFVISRDLDSRPSNREITYINNWVDSSKEYFIIRDHPWHSVVPAGLLGMKGGGEKFKSHFVNYIDNNHIKWGSDQEILEFFFKNISKDNIFYCGFNDKVNYIKRDDENFFIGAQLDESDNLISPIAFKFLKEFGL